MGNFSLLLSLAPSGTPILPANAFNFVVTTKASWLRVMDLVRFLVLISMKHNFLVRALHVPGVLNGIPDALFRFQVKRFGELAPNAKQTPCFIPHFIHDPLKDEVLRYPNWALSWNTKRTYTSGEKRFISFCLMNRPEEEKPRSKTNLLTSAHEIREETSEDLWTFRQRM